jgi:type IV secretion system protein VirB2
MALAQSGSPFDTGFTALQNLFTGTVAKVASLIAIVIGGYQFAHGEPGSKRVADRATGRGPARLLAGELQQWQQIETDSSARPQSPRMD